MFVSSQTSYSRRRGRRVFRAPSRRFLPRARQIKGSRCDGTEVPREKAVGAETEPRELRPQVRYSEMTNPIISGALCRGRSDVSSGKRTRRDRNTRAAGAELPGTGQRESSSPRPSARTAAASRDGPDSIGPEWFRERRRRPSPFEAGVSSVSWQRLRERLAHKSPLCRLPPLWPYLFPSPWSCRLDRSSACSNRLSPECDSRQPPPIADRRERTEVFTRRSPHARHCMRPNAAPTPREVRPPATNSRCRWPHVRARS